MNNNWNQNVYLNSSMNNNSNMNADIYHNNNANIYNNNAYWKQVNYIDSQDLEKGEADGIKYYDAYIRSGFIKKVYGILLSQIIFTTMMCIIAMIIPGFSKFQLTNPWLIWFSLILSLVCIIALTCCRDLSRKVPINYILLMLFTLSEGYLVSSICNLTEPRIVLMAASMTCFITFALTIYACTTKKDFTIYGSIIFVLACVMFLFSIFYLFTENKLIHIIASSFGVLIYSFYLVYDTQLLLGNKHNAMDSEDYILCAVMLYLDIINIFLYSLDLLRSSSE